MSSTVSITVNHIPHDEQLLDRLMQSTCFLSHSEVLSGAMLLYDQALSLQNKNKRLVLHNATSRKQEDVTVPELLSLPDSKDGGNQSTFELQASVHDAMLKLIEKGAAPNIEVLIRRALAYYSQIVDRHRAEQGWRYGHFLDGNFMPLLIPGEMEFIELPNTAMPSAGTPLCDLIDAGAYTNVSPDISEKYYDLDYCGGCQQLWLARFNRLMRSEEEVTNVIRATQYAPAKLGDLLVVGSDSRYQELQVRFQIVAWGSLVTLDNGSRVAPMLDGWPPRQRRLSVVYAGGGWHFDTRFLVTPRV